MQKTTNFLILLSLGAILVFLSGCSVFDDITSMFGSDSSAIEQGPDSMAMEALDEFNHGEYSTALKRFGEIQERFPFSRFSLMAELKSADCHYYLQHYIEAISSYQEFERSHPTNEAIPYVLFQISMSHYQQIDTIDRDPGAALDAEIAFGKLIRLYPQSPYTEETKARIRAARDFLANHEMYVAAFYIKTGKYKQSIGRLEYLLDNYPETSVAPEAGELLAMLNADKPPKSNWRDWIPEIGLPDWQLFKNLSIFKN